MITWHKIKMGWLKARIAYHRRKADSYRTAPVIRSFKRDGYAIWMQNMAMQHAMKGHDLERRLLLLERSPSDDLLEPSLQARRS